LTFNWIGYLSVLISAQYPVITIIVIIII